jgi:PAS domain S-box-containing protein
MSKIVRKDKLLAITNATQDAIIVIDNKGLIQFWNPAAKTILGYDETEALGQHLHKLLAPKEYHKAFQENFPHFVKTGEGNAVDKTLKLKAITKYGKEIFIELSLSSFQQDGMWNAVGVLRDVTEKNRNEMLLIESEERFQQITNISDFVIWEVDAQGTYTYLSHAAKKVIGYDPNYLIGRIKYYDLAPQEIREKFKKESMNVFKEKRGFKNLINQLVCADGKIITVRTNGLPILGEKGELLGYRGIDEDITQQIQIETELIKSKEHAEESDRLKSAFLMNMSHEIRTPMNGIMGIIQLLQADHIQDDEKNQFMEILKKSGQRLLKTLDDILEISKIESGALQSSIAEANMEELMKDCFDFNLPLAKEKGLDLILNQYTKDKQAIVSTDRSKIEKILCNLINNAVKFTDQGRIEFGNYVEGNRLIFFVKDTGIGIPETRQQQIFDRFVQAESAETRSHEGSGLGLTICKAYAESLSGSLKFESQEGKGTSFFFEVPYTPLSKDIITNVQKVNDKVDMNSNSSLILIAEDEDINYLMITKMLRSSNYTFIRAYDGKECVDLAQSNPDVALIMMDIKMPVMNGMDATRAIRKFNPDIPIIAQTAHAFVGEKEKIMDSGCTDYISKPIEQQELAKMVEKYLKNEE